MKAQVLVITADNKFINLADDLLCTRLQLEMLATQTLKSAAQLLTSQPVPALLILDLTLQDACCQPLELLQQLRSRAKYDGLPVLVLTDFPDPAQIQTALQTGANRYLTKSFVDNNLLPTVKELLRD